MDTKLTRRSFLTKSLALGTVAAAGGLLAGCSQQPAQAAGEERTWDREADVVVVGMGFAGLAAAYTAAKEGASVLLLEKAPEEDVGGTSRICGQTFWVPKDVEEATLYFKELTTERHLPYIDQDLIDTYIQNIGDIQEWFKEEFDTDTNRSELVEYPVTEAAKTMDPKNVMSPATGVGMSLLWIPIYEAVQEEANITILYSTPLTDLVFNETGEVIGVKASEEGKDVTFKAKKGVILALGGYEYNEEIKANYMQFPSLAMGSPYNTGDGINICMKYDIDFWHMTSGTPATFVGCKVPWVDEPYKDCAVSCQMYGDNGWLWTDKYGDRFMDETRMEQHGHQRTAIFYDDALKTEWPRIPLWQVFDEQGLPNLGFDLIGWLAVTQELSVAKSVDKFLEHGLLLKGETVQELADKMGVDAGKLEASIASVNAIAETGEPDSFGRPAKNTRALSGPFYAMSLEPGLVNTNGGPKHNADGNIVHVDGTPVQRLYAAGEFGSIWAWYYEGGGNVSECIAFGRISAKNAAALKAWDA